MKWIKGDESYTIPPSECQCSHWRTEEDVQLKYLHEYHAMMMSKDYLKSAEKKQTHTSNFNWRLTGVMLNGAGLSQEEKEIFSNPTKIARILADPMVNIMKTPKELEMMEKEDAGVKQSISPGKKTLGTRK